MQGFADNLNRFSIRPSANNQRVSGEPEGKLGGCVLLGSVEDVNRGEPAEEVKRGRWTGRRMREELVKVFGEWGAVVRSAAPARVNLSCPEIGLLVKSARGVHGAHGVPGARATGDALEAAR